MVRHGVMSALLGIDKQFSKFCFGCRCSNEFEYCGDDVDGTIEFNEKVVSGDPSMKEMAPNVAAGIGGIKVGCITVDVKYHVGGMEGNVCIWMSDAVV